MSPARRRFLSLSTGTILAGALHAVLAPPAHAAARYQAIVFDAFPIFDPRPIAQLAEHLFPGKGAALMNAWRTRQFEYQWWRALSGRYVDFWQTTADSLTFAARLTGLALSGPAREQLMGAYENLHPWPDAATSLPTLREAGIRLGFLSNMTAQMLESGLARANLRASFEQVLSTDAIRSYKPATAAYQLAPEAFALPPEAILFAAFAGWDVAGAKWFGYPTFWVNRLGGPEEELGVTPDGAGKDLQALTAFALQGARPGGSGAARAEIPSA